jgi:cobaltochelatase CobS
VPSPAPVKGANERLDMLNAFLDMMAPKVDESQVREILRTELGGVIADANTKLDAKIAELSMPTVVKIERSDGSVKTIDGAHNRLPVILKIIAERLHVLMVGPAGTGKSTIADQAAEALGLSYYSISLSPQTPASSILGYMQAAGEYVRSLYREAYEFGGVFHFDEFDNAHPSVLAVINASLANGQMAFPDAMVKRHADFVCVASANTYGRGPDRAYVGRQQIDAATLDRFTVVPVDVDEALEEAICRTTGATHTVVSEVLRYVRGLRKAAELHKMPLVFSPRASQGACKLLTAGLSLDEVIEFRVRRGISDQDWSKVSSGVGRPSI